MSEDQGRAKPEGRGEEGKGGKAGDLRWKAGNGNKGEKSCLF